MKWIDIDCLGETRLTDNSRPPSSVASEPPTATFAEADRPKKAEGSNQARALIGQIISANPPDRLWGTRNPLHRAQSRSLLATPKQKRKDQEAQAWGPDHRQFLDFCLSSLLNRQGSR